MMDDKIVIFDWEAIFVPITKIARHPKSLAISLKQRG